MKLTTTLETELLQVYHLYWDSYMRGDEKSFASLLHDQFKLIGTSENEIATNKSEAIEWFKSSMDEIAGKSSFRNRKIELALVNELVLIQEFNDLYLLVENEWSFYARFRASTLFAHIGEEWKIVQQHGSFPDARVQEGQTISFEKLTRENLELLEAVKRRTAELENKNRDLEIEASLERVRAVAKGMKLPVDMLDICRNIAAQLQILGIDKIRNIQTAIFHETNSTYLNYEYFCVQDTTAITEVAYELHPTIKAFVQQMQQDSEAFFTTEFYGEKLKEWIAYQQKEKHFVDAHLLEVNSLHYYFFSIGTGALGISTYNPLTQTEINLFQRFRNVFELAYRRFRDIQMAESQAREAQIEAALERVRAKAMAMNISYELSGVVSLLFKQFEDLGFDLYQILVTIIKKNEHHIERWSCGILGEVPQCNLIPIVKHPFLDELLLHWEDGSESFAFHLTGNIKNEWEDYLFTQTDLKYYSEEAKTGMRNVLDIYLTDAYMKHGTLEAAGPGPLNQEKVDILKRFARVVDLAYTRMNDLQVAEAQTKKANCEVALERVRARALAMQQPEELMEVAEVMRHEMGLLGVKELETSAIFINKENSDEAECWYAIKEGKQLVTAHFNLQYADTYLGRQMQDFYKGGQTKTSIVVTGNNLLEWINYCVQQSPMLKAHYGEISHDRTYHFYRFSHGAISTETTRDISAESWELMQRTASVFSLAYSRFKDLTKSRHDLLQLKEEKQRAETALAELQLTQKQLIQSEKMASLGELTAGIAHEIQNPLNFVNNFSDVSNELLDEMMEAIAQGNYDEAKSLVDDVKQNLEKINYHGKRADGIVKGMLQHSRSSNGIKEPTDINALADEYLRLAYHGLRAKDKTFNATMKTAFDDSIGNINVIRQDIGRVMLNLYTNAFYATNQKAKKDTDGYEPRVTVTTSKISQANGKTWVEISVADNGNGIPSKVLDKIFQPFFTTKPTGQGTGLGLSISYDIVKTHKGEINVTTKDGEGTEFVIRLPEN